MPRVIPFGDRILVKRKKIGIKASENIYLPDEVGEHLTELAEVVYVPELSFADKELVDNNETIVKALTKKAVTEGSSEALLALLQFNTFIKIKTIRPGDKVFIGKYVGTNFHETGGKDTLTMISGDQVIGLVVDE